MVETLVILQLVHCQELGSSTNRAIFSTITGIISYDIRWENCLFKVDEGYGTVQLILLQVKIMPQPLLRLSLLATFEDLVK